ncbi:MULTISPECIES: hypothetical protein [unclassified Moorena]|uniref:hypothetical protein n=1 Tax=unclassified Moorena TaxID=2683338 RepID=UPI0013BA50D2|nr:MULTISPECIES: hypothetical protein [unclassified Moorena]NEP30074.1 hypothetical protein [Moorena sp. SIO3B2]NEQ05798.1 hypothetical protein [Moorena sp. SIO4E2]
MVEEKDKRQKARGKRQKAKGKRQKGTYATLTGLMGLAVGHATGLAYCHPTRSSEASALMRSQKNTL